jgi:hypothetical protein
MPLPVAHHNVFYHEAAVHERDGGLDSELWCTGNLYVFTPLMLDSIWIFGTVEDLLTQGPAQLHCWPS